jgi:replicative DNA helicase
MNPSGPQKKGWGRSPQKTEPAIIAGRVPPHDLDAEAAVLSAILLSREALDRVLELLKPEHFYSDANGRIFEAMTQLAIASTPIDIVSVASYLRDRERLAQVGGPTYLGQLADATPAVAHVGAHAAVVYEKWRLRSLIATCQRVAAEGYGDVGDPQAFVDSAEQAIYELARTAQKNSAMPINVVLRAAFQQITAAAERGDRITGISTGYERIDAMTSGLHAGELVIVAARPGMGKCLSADAEITLGDGSVATIEEIHRRGQARLFTLGEDLKIRAAEPSHFVDDGVKPVFRVTTRLGRRVETTLSHPFLTLGGWRPLAEIHVGDHVAVPRELPVFGDAPLRECEVKLLAYLIGDGGLTGSSAKFTNTDPLVLQEFTSAVEDFGGVVAHPAEATPTWRAPTLAVSGDAALIAVERPRFGARLRGALAARGMPARALASALEVSPAIVSNWIAGRCVPRRPLFVELCAALAVTPAELAPGGHAAMSRSAQNPLVEWLAGLGLWGKGARGKFIPAPVFTLPRAQLALFLNRLFTTDGWATRLASGQAQLGYASVSERLARQVQHLLLRFGVIASLRSRLVKYRDERRPSWQVDITEATSIRRFAKEIGIFRKETALWSAVEATSGRAAHANRDVIPVGIWERLAAKKGTESWSSLARRAGLQGTSNIHVGKRGLSRGRLAALAGALQDAELARLAESDVYWDEIVSIEPLGLRQVYDLTVPETHNFIADDVCVHNTSFVMNIAANVAAPRTVMSPGPGEGGHGVERQEPGFGVIVFSLEMPREQLAVRMVCSEGRVDVGKVRQGHLQPDDWRKLTDAASWLSAVPVWLDDTPAISLLEVRAKTRRIQAEYDREATPTSAERKIGLVIIDYLQLMKGRDGVNSREQEISEISRGLKQLSKELHVPVIALSQLNRSVETRTTKDKRPQLSDLRESGAIEQDADMIMFIYRDEYYNAETTNAKGIAEIIIAKQRNGPTGKVLTRFTGSCTRFDNLAPGDYPDTGDDD